MLGKIFYDLRIVIRTLSRRPFYPIIAVLILALGLSAGVAVFTYINGFFQAFPGVNDDQLFRISGLDVEERFLDISYLDFLDYKSSAKSFEGIAATQPFYAASVRLETLTEVAFLEAVSGDYFSVLEVEMSLGRILTPEDDREGAESVSVISHDWWQTLFNHNPSVIGSTIFLNYRPFTIVGVAAPEYLGTASNFRPDVWIPIAPFRDRYLGWAKQAENRDVPLVRVFGRLRDSVSWNQAGKELSLLASGLDEKYPLQNSVRRIHVDSATWIDPNSRIAETPTLRLMTVAAFVLLLLVCANVANLLLSVAIGRQHETTMQAALGATPGRLFRQVLIENILLSTVAGTLGLLIAGPASARLGSYFARPSVWGENVARVITVDWRVIVFAVVISLITGTIAGLLPAIRASRRNLLDTLNLGSNMSTSGPRKIKGWRLPGINDLLVSIQVALSILLLVVAGLVLRTFVTVETLDPGFSYDHLLVTHVSTSSTGVKSDERERFFRDLAEGVAREPWVKSATVADYPLLSPHRSTGLRLEGKDEPTPLVYSLVIPGFFEALEIDLLRGRTFSNTDTSDSPNVVLINESLTRRYFSNQEPIGQRIWWPGKEGSPDRVFEIIGVVKDTKTQDFIKDPEPAVYFSYPQHPYPTGSALIVETRGNPKDSVSQLYQWLRSFEPHLAIVNVIPYPDVVSGFLYTQRMNSELFSVLAFLGLGLAAVGIFSVMSLAVNRRIREIGIRMSIGAERNDIGWLIIGRTLSPVVLGICVGLVSSFAVTRLVSSLLIGVEPTDPLTLFIGTGVFLVTALLAALLPAYRASRVDPVRALRNE